MIEKGSKANQFIDDVNVFALKTEVIKSNNEIVLLENAFSVCLQMIESCSSNGNKLIFIGNGGSAAIANHQALDYWKNGGIKAISFSDSSLLTCISNDFGYEYVFSKLIEGFSDAGDLVFAISSSGNSKNILNAVKAAKKKECNVVTFSGFEKNNSLCLTGDLNFYVPSLSYGVVEVVHHLLIHSMLEEIITKGRSV